MLLGGCGLVSTVSLEPTAKQYYDFLVGRGGNHDYSEFISPAYKEQISPENLEILNKSIGSGEANERFQAIELEDIAVSVDGIYGLSRANPKLSGVHGKLEPVKWVKVGNAWFLYMNSDAEISAYGHFPLNLAPPQFIPGPTGEGN